MFSDKFKNFFLYFTFFVYFAGAPSVFASSNILIFMCFLYSALCAYKDRRKFNCIVLFPMIMFALINIISIFRFGNGLDIQAYVGYNMRFIMAYFILKYVSNNFIDFFTKAIYLAALISIPFYLIQYIDVDFFYSNFSFLNMAQPQNIISRQNWNCLVYTSFPLLEGFIRNAGFTSEPSFFGFYLALGIIIEFIRSNYRFNKRGYVLLIVGLTTFSTTFYAVVILIGSWLAVKASFKYKIFLVLVTTIGVIIFVTSPFGMSKIRNIIEMTSERTDSGYDVYKEQVNLSRMDNIVISYTNFIRSPLGTGMNRDALFTNSYGVVMTASGSLLNYITQWGILFLILFPWVIWRFWKVLQPNTDKYSLVVLTIIFTMWMFSSIDHKDPLFFIVVIIGLLGHIPLKKIRILRYRRHRIRTFQKFLSDDINPSSI